MYTNMQQSLHFVPLHQCSTCFPQKVSDLRHCCITDLESFVFDSSLVAGPPAMILISLFFCLFLHSSLFFCHLLTFNCSLTLVPVSSTELTHFSLSLFLISLSEIYLLHYDGDLKCYSLTMLLIMLLKFPKLLDQR